jgi:putative Mg2+ transporter-C (MgtC) family protein
MNAAQHGPGLWMFAHMALALVLGWSVGYERHFSGRAAGSQVYCLVCTTSCAVTLLGGYPSLWYWGTAHATAAGDPTRVIGSILTGIGFLGAGIIVQSGLNVRGLTTAASIWGSSAIGILVGVGFYLPAIGLTVLFILSVAVVPWLESRLPARAAIAATLRFRAGYEPRTDAVHRFLAERGLSIPQDSLAITHDGVRFELRCMIIAGAAARPEAMNRIALEMAGMADVEGFTITHSSRA